MKNAKKLLILATLLIVVGGAFLLFFRDRQTGIVTPPARAAEIQKARAVAAATVAATNPDDSYVSGEPASIAIPSLGIDLAVAPGVYNEQTHQWTLSLDKAHYAVMTPQPNTQGGNTFIYGHYRRNVFASLHNIQPGAQAVVRTHNGKTFTYVYESNRIVAPEQSQGIFDYQGKPILTVQTCTGVFFENRQLFTFNLVSVS
jgi:LPXTG-site transpeptidase (sortase) family protein